MKVLVVTQYFWPESFLVNDLCTELQSRGHEVTVLTGNPNYPAGKVFPGYRWWRSKVEMFGDVKVVRSPLLPRGSGSGFRLALNYLSFVVFGTLTAFFRCREKYDVTLVMEVSPVTMGLPAIFMKWWKKIPIVFWVQDLWPESLSATGAVRSKKVLGWVAKLVKFIYKHCDCILVQSKAFEPRVRQVNSEVTNIQYLPNWAPEFFCPKEDGSETPKPVPGGFNLMFAGNLGAAQNLEILVQAAKELRDVDDLNWVIIGDGRRLEWLQEQIAENQLHKKIHLMGRFPAERMPDFFSHADALLVTLRKDPIFELTIPSKVQAYLACGRPILAALDGEGARIISEAEAGLCGPSGSVEHFVSNVRKLYAQAKEDRQKFGDNGRLYFEKHFSKSQVLDTLEHILHKSTP